MKNQMKVSFIHLTNKKNDKGAALYMRIRVGGKKADLATGFFLHEADWNPVKCKAESRCPDVRKINEDISKRRAALDKIVQEFSVLNKPITLEAIKNTFQGNDGQRTLLGLMASHNTEFKKYLGKEGFALKTYEMYRCSEIKLKEFLKEDVLLEEVSVGLLKSFETFLLTALKKSTARSYLSKVKKIVKMAADRNWIAKNPIASYKVPTIKSNPNFLTDQQRDLIANYKFDRPALQRSADKFIFCCYTGLAFADMAELSERDLVRNMQSELCIVKDRVKSNIQFTSPLFPPALAILEKYRNKNGAVIFPTCNINQYNEYLKEIQKMCKIEKRLTTHVARHTFATWYLFNGGSLYTLSKILGHCSVKMTEIYGRVTDGLLNTEHGAIANKAFGKVTKQIAATS